MAILYGSGFFDCRSSSAAHDRNAVPFFPAHDGGHGREGSRSHRGESHQSPCGLSGWIFAALECYNVTSNHIRCGSVYTSAALFYDIWYQWLYLEMNNILYILRLPSCVLTYAYLWNFCHCYWISIVPSDSFAI